MISDNSSLKFQEPIFGGQSVAGPASLAMIYSTVVYPEETELWINETMITFDSFIDTLENGNISEINDSLNKSIE